LTRYNWPHVPESAPLERPTAPPAAAASSARCRLCGSALAYVFADLGHTALANSYLRSDQLDAPEPRYPLRAYVCGRCFLAQLETWAAPESIFGDYAYFSSYSQSLLEQSKTFANAVSERLGLRPGDRVVEVASNDGYLLQYFLPKGLDVLGIEPAANIAEAARLKGVPTLVRFMGTELGRELASGGHRAQLLIANNVMAHVPDVNDFVAGLAQLLAPGGTLTVEFHHLLKLVTLSQFDNIYHEHLQYFSLGTASAALAAHGLTVVDVEELPTQGGSLRVYARHASDADVPPRSARVQDILDAESAAGLHDLAAYGRVREGIARAKAALLAFLDDARRSGRSVVCYGASAKGNTLLNVCGIRAGQVDYAVDRSPHKQGLFLPGSHIPVYDPARVAETRPDYVLLLSWNLRDEIMEQMAHIRAWGGRFVVPIPELTILE